MKRRLALISAAFGVGGIVGFLIAHHFALVYDFPRALALRSLLSEKPDSAAFVLRLLDLYEAEVNRHRVWLELSNFDWNQELVDINLRRYMLHSNLQQHEMAEEDLRRAARFRKRGVPPTTQDVEFERQLARKLYGMLETVRNRTI